jgi:hypothetical protein
MPCQEVLDAQAVEAQLLHSDCPAISARCPIGSRCAPLALRYEACRSPSRKGKCPSRAGRSPPGKSRAQSRAPGSPQAGGAFGSSGGPVATAGASLPSGTSSPDLAGATGRSYTTSAPGAAGHAHVPASGAHGELQLHAEFADRGKAGCAKRYELAMSQCSVHLRMV